MDAAPQHRHEVAPSLIEPAGSALPRSCRTLVVGAGLAGLEIAKELEARGVADVVVLEAGPADDLRHTHIAHSGDEALEMWLAPGRDPYLRRPWESLNPPHYRAGSGIRQRVGGRSLYWYGVTLPIEAWALKTPWWPRSVVADLETSWQGGDSLYARVRAELAAWRHADGRPVTVTRPAALGSFALTGVSRATRPSMVDPSRWAAYSALDAWRDPETGAASRVPAGVRIHAGVEVQRVLVADGAARGVAVHRPATGETAEIAASQVVLAAGTVMNSRLAIAALHDGGTGTTRLGGLADHIVQGFFLKLRGEQAARLAAAVPGGSYYTPCEGDVRSNLFLEVGHTGPEEVLVDLRVTGEQLPSVDSFVECTPAGTYPWETAVRSGLSDVDARLLKLQRDIVQGAFDTVAAVSGIAHHELGFGRYDNARRGNAFVLPGSLRSAQAGTPFTWSSFLGTEDHEGGTLPLGAILNDRHEFAGVRHLYAAGPATFPRLGAANPSLTTLALAHRLAAVLAG
jgi:choline dehydrogenase-like flavoprotein